MYRVFLLIPNKFAAFDLLPPVTFSALIKRFSLVSLTNGVVVSKELGGDSGRLKTGFGEKSSPSKMGHLLAE